jgi:hypothetical protein
MENNQVFGIDPSLTMPHSPSISFERSNRHLLCRLKFVYVLIEADHNDLGQLSVTPHVRKKNTLCIPTLDLECGCTCLATS